MKEVLIQIGPDYKPVWYGEESLEAVKDYMPNQILKAKLTGFKKQRSLAQLHTFWKVCTIIADNTGNRSWNHKDKVATQVKIGTQFIDASKTIVDRKGNVHLHYRSISFRELGHMEACDFFNNAYRFLEEPAMDLTGLTMDEIFRSISLDYNPQYGSL